MRERKEESNEEEREKVYEGEKEKWVRRKERVREEHEGER